MLDEKRLISATAVSDEQTIAANPVSNTKTLYNASHILFPPRVVFFVYGVCYVYHHNDADQ